MADPIFAVVTPFQSNSARSVDRGALRALLQFLAGAGVRRIICNGTTGEFPALSWEERRMVLQECRHHFSGEIIAHVSSCCARDVREAMNHGREYADAFLLLPPYYFAAPPAQGLVEFLAPLAETSPLPVYLYNFPRHTQAPLTGDVVAAVRDAAPNVRGIKDSSGDLQNALELKARLGPDCEVYLGADGLALRALSEGLDGSVTGGAQPLPELLVGLAAASTAGDAAGAAKAQEQLNLWNSARKQFPLAEPPILKTALSERIPGFPPHVRPPFLSAEPDQVLAIRQAVRSLTPSPKVVLPSS